MENLVTALFLLLWVGVAFFILRLLGRRYFHEPGRADAVALSVALAFALGVLWPYSARVGAPAPATAQHPIAAPQVSAAAVTAANAVQPLRPPHARNTSAACRSVKTWFPNPNGAIDTVFAWERPGEPVVDGDKMDRRDHYSIQGWAIDRAGDHPASGVCLVVDGKVDARARVYYGISRPDVAAAFHHKQLVFSGYRIDLSPNSLASGSHLIQVAARSANGALGILPPDRTVTVNGDQLSAVAPLSPPPHARDTTAACRSAKNWFAIQNGAIDAVFSWKQPNVLVVSGDKMDRRDHYSIQGWAINRAGDRPASGVCLIVDGKVDTRARVYYGISRPDVAAAFHHKQLVFSGYRIDLPPNSLAPGSHLIQVAARSANGALGIMPPNRHITVH